MDNREIGAGNAPALSTYIIRYTRIPTNFNLAVLHDRDRIEGGDLGKCVEEGADELDVFDAEEVPL